MGGWVVCLRGRPRVPCCDCSFLPWLPSGPLANRTSPAPRLASSPRPAARHSGSPADVAAGHVLNLRWLADLEQLGQFRGLDAFVWPNGPTGVSFTDAECAELYRRLRAFYNHPDWSYKVDPAKGYVRVEWEQFRSWICRTDQPADSPLRVAWAASTSCCAASCRQPASWPTTTWPAGAWSSAWVTTTGPPGCGG